MKVGKPVLVLIVLLLIFLMLLLHASADTGPKPSVDITFINMGSELCYGTLLSKTPSTGPYSVWTDDQNNIYSDDLVTELKRAFSQYDDPDKYYFLGFVANVSEDKELVWSYYPPDDFKILLYYPEKEVFVTSGVYQKYAFDSYYTVDMDGLDINSVEYDESKSTDARIKAYRSYDYTAEIVSFFVRMIITLVLELAVAAVFGIRGKKRFLFIAGVNFVTQLLLNIRLNIVSFRHGMVNMALAYVSFEFIVIVIEAVLYCIFLNKLADERETAGLHPVKRHAVGLYIVYALVANIVSFAVGLWLSFLIPSVF